MPKTSGKRCLWQMGLVVFSVLFLGFLAAPTLNFFGTRTEPVEEYLLDISNGTLKSVQLLGNFFNIDLSDLNITKIEDRAFDNLTSIKSLNLSRNELEYLPSTIFSQMTALRTLSLAENKIVEFPKDLFSTLHNLEILNVSHNALTHLRPKIFHGLTSYTDIFIEGNNLHTISSEIFHEAPRLHGDHSAYAEPLGDEKEGPSEKEKVPEGSSIVHLRICKTNNGTVTSLQSLDYNNSTINNTGIDHAINCTDIPSSSTTIHLENLSIKNFQKGWYKLSNVSFSTLVLTHNNITEITPEILNDLPPNVIDVDLSFNHIEVLRKNVIEARLKSLRINSNKISTIEEGALVKTRQTYLDLSSNLLTSLAFTQRIPLLSTDDELLNGLGSTTLLNFDNNKITNISENTFEELKITNNWKKAYFSISLANNEIEVIEEDSFADMHLVRLNLQNNRISTIPDLAFFITQSLTHLNLSNNLLMTIDESLFLGIKNLRSLDISGNKISNTNWCVAYSSNFRQLEKLDISRNPIERLENGALYGLVGRAGLAVKIRVENTPLKVIRGGVFDECRREWF